MQLRDSLCLWSVSWDYGSDELGVTRIMFPAVPEDKLAQLYGDSWKPNPAEGRYATEREAKRALIDTLREQMDAISRRIAELEKELE